MNEAGTCRTYVLPRLIAAGWDTDPHSFIEQKSFTDGRIVVAGTRIRRRPQKRCRFACRLRNRIVSRHILTSCR